MNSRSILREDGEIKTKLIIFMIICKLFIMIGAVEFLDMTLISDWDRYFVSTIKIQKLLILGPI
jgi:hypothetical protein